MTPGRRAVVGGSTSDAPDAAEPRHDLVARLQCEYEQKVPLLRSDLVPSGYQYPGRWAHIAEIYAESGMLRADLPLDGFLYDPDAWRIPTWMRWSVA